MIDQFLLHEDARLVRDFIHVELSDLSAFPFALEVLVERQLDCLAGILADNVLGQVRVTHPAQGRRGKSQNKTIPTFFLAITSVPLRKGPENFMTAGTVQSKRCARAIVLAREIVLAHLQARPSTAAEGAQM